MFVPEVGPAPVTRLGDEVAEFSALRNCFFPTYVTTLRYGWLQTSGDVVAPGTAAGTDEEVPQNRYDAIQATLRPANGRNRR